MKVLPPHGTAFIRTEEFVRDSNLKRHRILPKVSINETDATDSSRGLSSGKKKGKLLTRKKRSMTYRNYPELEPLDDQLKNVGASGWKERLALIDEITNFSQFPSEKIKRSKYYFIYFDTLTTLINDSNTKVQTCAI